MARAIAQVEAGEVHRVLKLLTLQKPCVGRGGVLVRITIRPIHPYYLALVRGGVLLKALPPSCLHPPVTGSEGFGVVEEVGEGVTKFKPGQRVVPLVVLQNMRAGEGSWQEYVALDEDQVVAVPEGVSDEAAAQFVINPWTVYGILHDLAVPRGEYVLQTAAGSVLGRQVIQVAKHWGLKTINIVRRDTWKEELTAIGADEVINSVKAD